MRRFYIYILGRSRVMPRKTFYVRLARKLKTVYAMRAVEYTVSNEPLAERVTRAIPLNLLLRIIYNHLVEPKGREGGRGESIDFDKNTLRSI